MIKKKTKQKAVKEIWNIRGDQNFRSVAKEGITGKLFTD